MLPEVAKVLRQEGTSASVGAWPGLQGELLGSGLLGASGPRHPWGTAFQELQASMVPMIPNCRWEHGNPPVL